MLTGALASAPALATTFPTANSLADQLKMVARMISAAPALGAKRQVFFVSLGGFDNHDAMLTAHPGLLDQRRRRAGRVPEGDRRTGRWPTR